MRGGAIDLPANVAAITLVKSEPCQKAKGRREMLEVASIQAQARASRIACQMRSLVAGMSRLLTPSGASAPTTALTIAGSAPTVPRSYTQFPIRRLLREPPNRYH